MRCSTLTIPGEEWGEIARSVVESISTNGSNRPNSRTWHRLAVWTVGALVAGIRSKTRV